MILGPGSITGHWMAVSGPVKAVMIKMSVKRVPRASVTPSVICVSVARSVEL